jgi:hypothetical protein
MSFRNSVIIVASPRSRVGKTLLARLMTEFHQHEGRAVAAFDLNTGDQPGATLVAHLPDSTVVSAIGEVTGQMALFDRLIADDESVKVVDLGHAVFEQFFVLAQKFGFAEEAIKRGIAPAILFIIPPDASAVEAYRDLRARFPRVLVAPVDNEACGNTYRVKYQFVRSGEVMVRLPMLAPGLRKFVETAPFSFTAPADAAALPVETRRELQRWLRRVFREFREFDLRSLLVDLQSSIRLES